MPVKTADSPTLLNFMYIPCVPFLTYLGLPAESMTILAILLTIDYFTGVLKIFIIGGSLKSYRAVAGILTKGSILLLVLSLAFMAKGLNMDFELYLKMFISVLIISETYSIFGNVYVCMTKKDIEESDAVALAIGKVRAMIEKLLVVNRDNLK